LLTGETALSVAKTSNLKHLVKQAWIDQSSSSQLSLDLTSDSSSHDIDHQDPGLPDHLGSHDVPQDRSPDVNQSINSMASQSKKSCFITQVSVVVYCSCNISCDPQASTPLSSPPTEEHLYVNNCHQNENNILPHLDSDIDYHADVETDCGPGRQHNEDNACSSKQQHKQKMKQQIDQKPSGQHETRRPSLEGKDVFSKESNKVTLKKQNSFDDKKFTTTTTAHHHHQDGGSQGVSKLTKINSGTGSYSVAKKKHQQLSGPMYRSHSGSTLYQQQQQQQNDNNSRLPVVKSCSGK